LLDPEGTTDSEYRIAIEGASASGKPVPGGSQGKNLVWASEAVTPWESSHLDVPLDRPADFVAADGTEQTYRANDTLTADLDGEKLWRIDLGANIRAGAHYSQPQLYDFDSD